MLLIHVALSIRKATPSPAPWTDAPRERFLSRGRLCLSIPTSASPVAPSVRKEDFLDALLRSGTVISVLALCVACGGGSNSTSSTSPTSPTPTPTVVAPTPTSLSIASSSDLILLGQSATYSATARYSDGSSRSALATWESSSSGVVSVTALSDGSARATAQSAGSVTLTARFSGLTATVTVRGLPDVSGIWAAQVRATSCSPPARWGSSFCGSSWSVLTNETLQLQRSSGDGVVGSVQYTSWNGNVWTGAVTGRVNTDGTLTLTGRLDSPRPTIGFFYYGDLAQWTTRLSPSLGMTGSYSEIVTLVGEPDKAFLSYEIVRATKG